MSHRAIRGDYVCPQCGAIDSTHCEFRIGAHGTVVPSQVQRARERGCRVVFYTDLRADMECHDDQHQ